MKVVLNLNITPMNVSNNKYMSSNSIYNKNIFILIFVILASVCEGQQSITWQKTYDNGIDGNNEGYDMCQSTPGFYFFVGFSYTHQSLQVIKINDYGDTIWSRLYLSYPLFPNACTPADNGSCVIVGIGTSRIKIDSSGSVVWFKSHGGFDSEQFDVFNAIDKGFIICGTAINNTKGYILKIDSLGNLKWEKFYSAGSQLNFKSIREAFSNGYILCGASMNGSFGSDGIVIKCNDEGDEVWRKFPMPTLDNNTCNTIRKFQNGYLTVGGHDSSYIVKLDSNGILERYKSLPIPDSTHAFSFEEIWLETDSKNNVIQYRNQGAKLNQGYFTHITKLDSTFNILSEKDIKKANNFFFISSCLALENLDLIFAGFSEFNGAKNTNFYALRTDSDLNYPPLKITHLETQIPDASKLISNYPNPFNGKTKIKFQVDKSKNLTLKIYNSLGQEITTLINDKVNQGKYEVDWNANNLATGVYYILLFIDKSLINSLKIILIK